MGSSHGGNVFLKTKGRFIETKYDILASAIPNLEQSCEKLRQKLTIRPPFYLILSCQLSR